MLFMIKNAKGEFHYLLNSHEYFVGRQDTRITIKDDKSISRKHALLKVVDEKLHITDCGSKFGTFLNDNAIEANSTVTNAVHGDKITFGVCGSVFRLICIKLVTSCSGLNEIQKSLLKRNLEIIGAEFSPDWSTECNSLTVENMCLTIKVLHALIDEKPIVTVDYWKEFAMCVRKKTVPPKCETFSIKSPPNSTLKLSLTPDVRRKTLFCGKIFVFSTRSVMISMQAVIEKIGGKCRNQQNAPLNPAAINVKTGANLICVTNDSGGKIPDNMNNVFSKLTALFNYRIVAMNEIAKAIALCNCTKDCNPFYSFASMLISNKNVPTTGGGKILVPETQDEDFRPIQSLTNDIVVGSSLSVVCQTQATTIPPSIEFVTQSQIESNRKRKFSEDDNASKCPKICIELDRASPEILSNASSTSHLIESILDSQSDDVLDRQQEQIDSLDAADESVSDIQSLDLCSKPNLVIQKPMMKRKLEPSDINLSEKCSKTDTTSGIQHIFAETMKNVCKENETVQNAAVVENTNPRCISPLFGSGMLSIGTGKSTKKNWLFAIAENNSQETSLNRLKNTIDTDFNKEQTESNSNGKVVPSEANGKQPINASDLTNWLSKSEISAETSTLVVTKELQTVYDQFQNAVIVKRLPMSTYYQEREHLLNTDNSSKNFKTFKKVLPLRPQQRIIT